MTARVEISVETPAVVVEATRPTIEISRGTPPPHEGGTPSAPGG